MTADNTLYTYRRNTYRGIPLRQLRLCRADRSDIETAARKGSARLMILVAGDCGFPSVGGWPRYRLLFRARVQVASLCNTALQKIDRTISQRHIRIIVTGRYSELNVISRTFTILAHRNLRAEIIFDICCSLNL
jgi:hypothetical protein